MSNALAYLLIAIASACVTLALIDRFVVPIPFVRKWGPKIFWGIAALATLGGALLLLKRKKNADPDEVEPVEPEKFDDEPERKTDADADNTDLDATSTDRDVAALDDAADARDDDLDDLRSRLDNL
jgi:hypothetical protein